MEQNLAVMPVGHKTYQEYDRLKAMLLIALNKLQEKNSSWYEHAKNIPFRINHRMKRVLGRARIGFGFAEIEISGEHLRHSTDDGLMNTITHELAHHIAYQFYKEHGHGMHWQNVHMALGGNGKRLATKEDAGHEYKRNKIQRIIIQHTITGKEYKITLNNWNKKKHLYLTNGYKHIRTEIY